MDAISEARLAEVMPALAERIRQLAQTLEAENIAIRVVQGLRTWADQDKLYAIGRTLPGKVVTNAKGGESWHCYGCAVDVAPFDDGVPDWNASHPAWRRIVEVGVSLGLESGVSWHDLPHFQLSGAFPPTPDQKVKDLYVNVGRQAVWDAVSA